MKKFLMFVLNIVVFTTMFISGCSDNNLSTETLMKIATTNDDSHARFKAVKGLL